MLEVLAVSHSDAPWGAERRLLDLAPRLAELDIDLVLAAPDGELASLWCERGHRWVVQPQPRARGMRRDDGRRASPLTLASQASASAAAGVRIARLARRLGVDVLHSHALNAHPEVAVAGRLAGVPTVLDLHDIVVPGFGRRVLGAAAALADIVIANSRATAATVAGGDVRVVNPGVDVERFHPGPADPTVRAELAADPTAPVVGILGRVDPEKGIDVVLRAVARLERVQAVVVGAPNVADETFAEELRSLGDDLLGARARFVGPRDDVPDVLRALDVLVNASRAEPFGRTVLEAQASGVPVIGTDAGGIPEFVTDGTSGRLVPPGDAAALASAIAEVLGDAELRETLRAGGLEAARSRSVPNQAALVAAIYRDAVNRRGSRRTRRI